MEKLKLPLGVRQPSTIHLREKSITSVGLNSVNGILALGAENGTIQLWDPRSCQRLGKLEGHISPVLSVTFDPLGEILASGSWNGTIKLWKLQSGELLRTIRRHSQRVYSLAFGPDNTLASGNNTGNIKMWEPSSGNLLRTLVGHKDSVLGVGFDSRWHNFLSWSRDGTIRLWDSQRYKLIRTIEGRREEVRSVAFDHSGEIFASGNSDGTVKLWETTSGMLLSTLEGHTAAVRAVAFSPSGDMLATQGADDTIRLWRAHTWEPVAVIPEPQRTGWDPPLAFHPNLPLLVTGGTRSSDRQLIHLWTLDRDVLFGANRAAATPQSQAVHHTTAKVVLLGDHAVGKSSLGYRMVHGHFIHHSSTHGQQFWVFPELGRRRADGTECEAILWDLAGQPDYRLVNALFVDDADLAIVLFDASDIRDPLHGVGFWLKQLQSGPSSCPAILVGAQIERGTTLTDDELKAFCRQHGIAGPVRTSAATGEGVEELIEQVKALIPWDNKAATVTTTTFKRIKDYVLGLKEAKADGKAIVSPSELRQRLEVTDLNWQFTDAEMLTAVGHLENYGYAKRLRTSKGEQRILLAPELLNNLASSFVLEARRNPRGLGSLEEKHLLAGYAFPELVSLSEEERAILLDSATLLFLEHNVCFRETDPLSMESYLVFPELINLKKPLEEDKPADDTVAYTVNGATENVFASLVVLLGYTHTFTRTNQWQNNARYEVGDGLVCGFRQDAERDGELDFVLYFGPTVSPPVQTLFQSLFESFLARRNLTVLRYEAVRCVNGHLLDRSVVRQRRKEGKDFTFCNECGDRLKLRREEPIQLTEEQQAEFETQRSAATERTRFEQAIFRVQAYVSEQKIKPPECFVSYAWGVREHERWVERSLATDLQKAGVQVVLDRWENARVGASVARFIERIGKVDRVIVVGSPLYRRKYENKDSEMGYVVAAEVDVISNRLLGTEAEKESVLPALLAGDKKESLPELLWGRVHADFRDEQSYFLTSFDLILSLYGIKPNDPAVADLRESLGPEMMRSLGR